ncbi:ATP-binding protein [Paenibacillus plantiphilus]|nr:ATP-binding protein [Paenibacillus plantiphilus]
MYDTPSESIVKLSLRSFDDYSNRLQGTMAIVVDSGARVVRCNMHFLRETGYSASFIENKPLRMFLRDGSSSEWVSADRFLRSLTERVVEPMTVLMSRADGSSLCVLVIRMVIETELGILTMLLLYNQEPAMKGSLIERFGKTMLTDEHIGVVLLQPDSRILDISPLACQVLGVCKAVVVNEPLSRFFANAENEYAIIRSALEYGDAVRNYPITWIHKERTELLMDVGWLRSPDGSMEGAYIIFKDITNLRSLEEQVQRSDRLAMIGQIAAGAAHEIRNPLTAIRGFLQMFRKTMIDRDMSKEVGYTDIMLTELDRINELVSEFLMLSKPRNVVYDEVDIHTVLNGIMPVISSEATLHDITVHWEMAESLPSVTADREMLKQVFLNICKNGIEAMTEGGILTIQGRAEQDAEGEWIIIDIQDNGPGIPVHMLDKIFDPFVTTKANGTGLGLSVCQRILHEFDGTIRAVSREDGAQFTIILPC